MLRLSADAEFADHTRVISRRAQQVRIGALPAFVADRVGKVPDAVRPGVLSGKNTCAANHANSSGHIGVVEHDPARGQFVDVGRLYYFVSGVAEFIEARVVRQYH
nr:hypothetical protein [Ereboglobus luteus]